MSYAIVSEKYKAMDGWYFQAEEAKHMLGWWQIVYYDDVLHLVEGEHPDFHGYEFMRDNSNRLNRYSEETYDRLDWFDRHAGVIE